MGGTSRSNGFTDRAFGFGQCFSLRAFLLEALGACFLPRIATLSLLSVVLHAAVATSGAWAQTAQPFSTQGVTLDATSYFLEAPEYGSVGQYAESVAVADVNGDGIPDLVVANACLPSGGTCPINYGCTSNCVGGEVAVLLGNGDGTFQTPVAYNSGGVLARSVAVADVNGDGRTDIIVGNAGSNTIGVLLGNGDGTFQPAATYSGGQNGAGGTVESVAIADVNGDGKPDVLVAISCTGIGEGFGCADAGMGVFLGNGNGTFQAPTVYSFAGASADSIAVADLNADGKPDVVVSYNTGVAVLLGNGNGTFQSAVEYGSWNGGTAVVVADLNGDGRPDVIAATLTGVEVLLGNGNGTLQTPVLYSAGGIANSVAVADVNNDGKPDVLVAGATTYGAASVLLGNGDGTFQPPVAYGSSGTSSDFIAVSDVNLDGKPDLVAVNYSSGVPNEGAVAVLLGNGDGTFQAAPLSVNAGGAQVGAAADVNGDGIPDLIVSTPGTTTYGTVGVMLGTGDGTFQRAVNYSRGGIGVPSSAAVAVADVNGDGIPDLLVPNWCISNCGGSNIPEGTVAVLLGNGNGTFKPAVNFSVGGAEVVTTGFAVADVNGDGKPDVIVTACSIGPFSCGGYVVSVLLGNGDGTFQTAVLYSVGNFPGGIAVADVNGDGKPDIVFANDNAVQGTVGVLLGNGNGTFQQIVTYPTSPGGGTSVAVADVNGDGKPDLLVSGGLSSSNYVFAVLLGNGDGTFQTAKTYPTPGGGTLEVADFNGDGKLDVAAAGNFLLLGNGDGTFQSYLLLGVSDVGIAMADFNGDGRPDLALGTGVILLNHPSLKTPTAIALISSLNPSAITDTVSFTAAVTGEGGVPTGKVIFVSLRQACGKWKSGGSRSM